MDKVSILEIFKIGIGPSSSHAMGPWKAAADFLTTFVRDGGDLSAVHALGITLFGSLAKTGLGHDTDKALLMGLSGKQPERTSTRSMVRLRARLQQETDKILNGISLLGGGCLLLVEILQLCDYRRK